MRSPPRTPALLPSRVRLLRRQRLLLLRLVEVLLLAALPAASATITVANHTGTVSNTSTFATKDLNATDASRARHQQQQQQLTVSALLQATGDVRVAPALLAAAALVTGLGMAVAGYRLFRASVFACAFAAGGLAAARAVESVFSNESYLVAASWIAFVGAGLLAGCVAAALYYAGIFAVGAAGGVLLAVALSAGVGHEIYPSNPDTVLLVLVIVLGVAGGMTAVCLEKPALIAVTSFVGAALAVWGIGYFAGNFPSGDALRSFRAESTGGGASWFGAVPGAWWGYFAALVALTAVGVLVQRRVTARDGYYDARGGGFVKEPDMAVLGRRRRGNDGGGDPRPSRISAMTRRVRQAVASGRGRSSAYDHAQTPSTRRTRRPPRSASRRRRYESDFIV